MKRRFSRLSGLLELADDEFVRLRTDLVDYENHVKRTLVDSPEKLELNQSTLSALLDTATFKEFDRGIADLRGSELAEDVDTKYVARRARVLSSLGVVDAVTVINLIDVRRKHAVNLLEKIWVGADRPVQDVAPRGVGLLLLEYTLVATANESAREKWIDVRRIPEPRSRKFINRIDAVWPLVVEELGNPDVAV
ncbi:hypothetical protein [Rhodococcus sp. IEGM 1379]|uniref:hypothetical protein n=1 Tax=Rhodococcus sp. IEGM 1379 TaxID=3047086 RepID=UPI0024B6C8C8|nr:hypothetical protein [Rhodococcus sp. IEGM 1379]MDI9918699.1 hypothetical protein [Rhodococcus sp. IEGM 1379]